MNTLEKEFIPYEQALALKELGFDEPCLAYWFNETPTNPQGQCIVYYKKPWDNEKIVKGLIREYCSAPTFSQCFRWFREKYGLIHGIQMSGIKSISYDIRKLTEHHYKTIEFSFCSLDGVNTYEEAELACLQKLIQIVKNEKHTHTTN
jgi:hypothetical protein